MKLTIRKQISYAFGQLGWATLLNILYTLLVYYYLPPQNANLPQLISNHAYFGLVNAIVLIAAFGRILEVFTDPLIAGFSDRSKFKWGRRIPFMALGCVPAALFCALMFIPPDSFESTRNLWWLVAMQILYYPFFSLYVIPYSALLIEMTDNEKERLSLSSFTSLAYALSSLTAAFIPLIGTSFQNHFSVTRITGVQWAIGLMCALSAIWMLIPVFTIKENKMHHAPSHEDAFKSLKTTFQNPRFIQFVISDCMYWMGLNIVSTGMLYYIKVLLGLSEDNLTVLMLILLVASFSFYPVVNFLANRYSRKKIIQTGFVIFGFVFALVFFGLGRMPFAPFIQATIIMILAAIPFAILGILPNTVLADIAEHDLLKTGNRKEGMYFAARTMIMKLGQTVGIILFTIMLTFGHEVGNDFGIRLSALTGFILCLIAAVAFQRYNEKNILQEIDEMKKAA